MSGWLGLNTAISGLFASQKSLYTTNHNISNANTEGYSRQKAVQHAADPLTLPGIGMLGTGTEITEIKRIRDSYIDYKYWSENSSLGEWQVKRDTLVNIENIFNEPSDSSFRQYLDEFFNSLETLSTDPSSYAHRSLVKEKAVALTNHLNETVNRLYSLQKELNFGVKTKIKQVNDIAGQIRNLNDQIYRLEIDGTKANDLRDRRALLVDKLSKIVNVQVSENSGKYRVSIGGIALVDHVNISKIKYPPPTTDNKFNPKEKLYKVEWETGETVDLKGGELKALLDLRDGEGEGNIYRGVPFYIKRLDEFAQKLAEKMNEVHSDGWGLNNTTGTFLFTAHGKKTSDYTDLSELLDEIRAENISLSGDIKSNSDYIAASSANIAAASNPDGVKNNENALELIELREDKNFFDTTTPQGTPDDFIKAVLSNFAVDSQHANRMEENQDAIMANIKQKRESKSGVSIDEEMSNMVKFQHSYNAAAKMITTIDEIYEVTINRLGLVGR
ncbi:flagellar hook-associated protein FlgK [Thermohalobacter berrensis]|uniref:Flagellar hook-associated protein 1 n=1 Tax=Thermohalobacter berrensis TaxID=99594 RepID=A0A419T447_9FIRM|nr:flagellar hook-associated protein FlgK [Thermohalobacter berrensis]RKD32330.1 flagellar hook-associated protein FlgK [Thermohalobacter berrensis]